MKYLKKFQTHSAYNTYINGNPVLPNVSFCKDQNDVHYNKDPYNGHEYVEIAGIKWATMNIGANSPTDYGLYFQWADTQGYTAAQVGVDKQFTEEDCKYGPIDWDDTTNCGLTKYNSTDEKTILEPIDDAVTIAWGSDWRMPTVEEFQALSNAVNRDWTNYQGGDISGMILTDKTDESKTLFFPACGIALEGILDTDGFQGGYWSKSLYGDGSAYYLSFASDYAQWANHYVRCYGLSIRGVFDSYHTNGHTFVDLGLPSGTKWATMNVGASSETEYGNYYMYGKGATQYNSSDTAYTGTENPLDLSVDTARQVWGGAWHMPTETQLEELVNNTSQQWVENYESLNVNGCLFTAQNGNKLFLPAAGYYELGGKYSEGESLQLWSSTPGCALLCDYMDTVGIGSNINRSNGFSIRPVIG